MLFLKTVVIVLAIMTGWQMLRMERVSWWVVIAAAIVGILCFLPSPVKQDRGG